jgi:hypothetical protein
MLGSVLCGESQVGILVEMTRSLRLLLASVAIVALLGLGTGLALATGGHHVRPPAAGGSTHGDDERGSAGDREHEPAETGDDSWSRSHSKAARENHGSFVSKVARETPPGPQHGKIVSAAAHANHGAAKRSAHAGS